MEKGVGSQNMYEYSIYIYIYIYISYMEGALPTASVALWATVEMPSPVLTAAVFVTSTTLPAAPATAEPAVLKPSLIESAQRKREKGSQIRMQAYSHRPDNSIEGSYRYFCIWNILAQYTRTRTGMKFYPARQMSRRFVQGYLTFKEEAKTIYF